MISSIQHFFYFLGNAPKDDLFLVWWLCYFVIGWLSFSLAVFLYRNKGDRQGLILTGILVFLLLGPLGSILGLMCLILHHPAVCCEMDRYAETVADRVKKGIEA